MAGERTKALATFLKKGLALDSDDFVGGDSAANDSSPVFRGIRPTDFGGRRPPQLVNSLNRVKLAAANGGQDYYQFPFPQIFYGRRRVFFYTPPFIVEYDVDADTYSLLGFPANPAQWESDVAQSPPHDPTNDGDSIHFADFGDSWFGFKPSDVMISTAFTGNVIEQGKTINTGCAFRGQLITAGFDPTDYWGSDWKTLWDTWAAEAKVAGVEVGSSGPKQNWVGWSQVGGGDILNLFFPNSYALWGENFITEQAQVALPKRGEHIVELPITAGVWPAGWLRGLKARQISTESEDVIRSSRVAEFWKVATLGAFVAFQKDTPDAPTGAPRRYRQELKYVSPRFSFKSGTSYDITYDYYLSHFEIGKAFIRNGDFAESEPSLPPGDEAISDIASNRVPQNEDAKRRTQWPSCGIPRVSFSAHTLTLS